jgi:hypothetical protein
LVILNFEPIKKKARWQLGCAFLSGLS